MRSLWPRKVGKENAKRAIETDVAVMTTAARDTTDTTDIMVVIHLDPESGNPTDEIASPDTAMRMATGINDRAIRLITTMAEDIPISVDTDTRAKTKRKRRNLSQRRK